MPVPTADDATSVRLTNEDRDSGIMSDIHLYDALEVFYEDGLFVIQNAVQLEVLDALNERMKVDTGKLLKGQGLIPNAGRYKNGVTPSVGGSLNQAPPLEKILHSQSYANKHAARVLSNILGPRPELRYIRSNTLLRTKERQIGARRPLFRAPHSPLCYCIEHLPDRCLSRQWIYRALARNSAHRWTITLGPGHRISKTPAWKNVANFGRPFSPSCPRAALFFASFDFALRAREPYRPIPLDPQCRDLGRKIQYPEDLRKRFGDDLAASFAGADVPGFMCRLIAIRVNKIDNSSIAAHPFRVPPQFLSSIRRRTG